MLEGSIIFVFAIAIALINLEMFLYSFVVILFGLGFIIVGILSLAYSF